MSSDKALKRASLILSIIVWYTVACEVVNNTSANVNDELTREIFRFIRDSSISFQIRTYQHARYDEAYRKPLLHINLGEHYFLYFDEIIPRHERNMNEEGVWMEDYYNLSAMISNLPSYEHIEMIFTQELNRIDQAMINFNRQINLIEIRFNEAFPNPRTGRNADGLTILIEFQGERFRINEDNNGEVTIRREKFSVVEIPQELIDEFTTYIKHLSEYELVDSELRRFQQQVEGFIDLVLERESNQELAIR